MEELGKTYNTRELLKADVVELATGSVVGQVVEAIVNTRLGLVEFLGIRPAQWHLPGALLKTSDILGFDESVLLIRSENTFAHYEPSLNERHSFTCSHLYTLKLIDHEGHVLGNPVGIVFSPAGRILAMEAEKDLVMHIIPLGRIIAVGDRFIVVDLTQRKSQRKNHDIGASKTAAGAHHEAAAEAKPHGEEEDPGPDGNGGHNNMTAKFRERQVQFMLGKASPLTLHDKKGNLIIALGETITGQTINRLIDEGVLNEVFVALTVSRERIPSEEPEIKPE